jgi:hypothetical protein
VLGASYSPNQWRDFFVMLGGGSAALTGLVFVAMSLNLEAITRDATHKYRAISTLTGFVAAFAISALALLGGEDGTDVGIEWLAVSSLATAIFLAGYVLGQRQGGTSFGLYPARLVIYTAAYVAQITGAALLVRGQIAGLYIASVAVIFQICFAIWGAWLLILGARNQS